MPDLNALDLPALFDRLTADGCVERLAAAAMAEDLDGPGDVTSRAMIEPGRRGSAVLVARQGGVVAGLAAAPAVLRCFDPSLGFTAHAADGATCAPGQSLGRASGNLRGLLAAERTLLNLLGRLGGVARLARRFVEAVAGTGAVICDTRKTTPGLRALEKYAARCGGATLHRLGLFDAALFKDNHLAGLPAAHLPARITAAASAARAASSIRFVEVEVDSLDQLRALLRCPAGTIDIILLDNMPLDELRRAVALRGSAAPHVLLEASGGVRLETVRAVAETGVDRISVGAITHSAPALDLAMEIEPA
jgi:nicotinate-nucleotide pyrophosphorylase (carboxylating)